MIDDGRQVLLRSWPGLAGWRAPHPSRRERRLSGRPTTMYMFAAAALTPSGEVSLPECFGLGAALVTQGRYVLNGTLVIPDGLAVADPGAAHRLRRFAARHPLDTPAGLRPWHVATVSAFYDHRATVEGQPWAFQPAAYSPGGWVVGADLGRTLALAAEHCGVAHGRNRKGGETPASGAHERRRNVWQVWPPGWSTLRTGKRGHASPERPALRLSARRVGWQVDWEPREKGRGNAHPGEFVDVLSLAYSLDASRGASFAEHCRAFGIDAGPLPLAVPVDVHGAELVTATLRSIRDLMTALDDEAGGWLTTPEERNDCVGRVSLSRTVSPGAMAANVLARFGLRPPIETFGLDADEHRRWAEAFHGGWCDLDDRLRAIPFSAVTADLTSAYPLTAHLLGWWQLVTAERVVRRGVTRQLRALCRQGAVDPSVLLDPQVWERFGATLVEVAPEGERFCVAVDDERRPDGRTEVLPVTANGRTLWYAWCDVAAAAVLSGRAPHILQAIRYEPTGRQQDVRQRIPVIPGA
ncbi:MAG: hypothetical protein ACYCU6_11945, partial [Acidimicrobiales bacterium]